MTDTVDPVDRTALAKRGAWADNSLAALRELRLTTPEQEQWAAGKLQLVQAELVANEADRTAVTGPINKDLKRINGEYKPVTDKLEEMKTLLKAMISAAASARLDAQEAARLAAVAAATSGDSAGCSAALAAIPEDVKLDGAGTKFVWVVASCDVSKMDPDYLSPNLGRILAFAKAHTGDDAPQMAGVVFERQAVTRVNPKGKTK